MHIRQRILSLTLAFALALSLTGGLIPDTISAAWPSGCVVLLPNLNVAHGDLGFRTMDVAPFIDNNNRLQVPLRFITEELGASVSFTAPRIRVIFNDLTVDLELGSPHVLVDDWIAMTMDTVPTIISDRTFVPLRFLAEAFGLHVHYQDGIILVGTRSGAPLPAEAAEWTSALQNHNTSTDPDDPDTVKLFYEGYELIPPIGGGELTASAEYLLMLGIQVLEILKNEDWGAMGHMTHPTRGVTFSPYGYVDEDTALTFFPGDVAGFDYFTETFIWGEYDGSANPIEMTFQEYYDTFIISADYSMVAVDQIVRTNLLSNLYIFGNGGGYIEFYFPGIPGELQDFTWASLRLVFADYEGDLYVIAIVHDQWTI